MPRIQFKELATGTWQGFLNLLYPRRCIGCSDLLGPEGDEPLCLACRASLRTYPEPWCSRCGHTVERAGSLCASCRDQRPFYAFAVSAYLFDGALRESVHHFKYNNRPHLDRFLGRLLADRIKARRWMPDAVDTVTCVPMGFRGRLQRGYNPSELLARQVAAAFALPFSLMLVKRRQTRPQNELTQEKRLSNLDGAFCLRPKVRVRDRVIAIVDDVLTTGATVNECARILTCADAKKVIVFTLARGETSW